MDASSQPGLASAAFFYAVVAAFIFFIYLIWLAAIRNEHAGEKTRPWLQYAGATFVIGLVVTALKINPFLGMLPTLLIIRFIPDKLRYYLLATVFYCFIVFIAMFSTHSKDHIDSHIGGEEIYPNHLIDKTNPFAVTTVRFNNDVSMEIPHFPEYETSTRLTEDAENTTYIYELHENDDAILSLGLTTSSQKELKNSSFLQLKRELSSGIVMKDETDILVFMKDQYEKKNGKKYICISVPAIIQNTATTFVITFSLVDEKGDCIGGYYGVVLINNEPMILAGVTHLGFSDYQKLILTALDKIVDLNQNRD